MEGSTAKTSHHILPLRVYLTVGAALMVLTATTVIVSFFHFGPYNLVVAMLIAATKATLVALFFMHLKYDSKFYMVIFVTSIIFLAIFVILTMFDTLRRADVYEIESRPIRERAVMYDSLEVRSLHEADSSSVSTDSPDTLGGDSLPPEQSE